MEKICIVRRRNRNSHDTSERGAYFLHNNAKTAVDIEDASSGTLQNPTQSGSDIIGGYHERFQEKSRITSFELTPKQAEFIQANNYFKHLQREHNDVEVNVRKEGDGRIIFSFFFQKSDSLNLLKPEHVCRMLQISRSSLMRFVKAKKIKSYKIGRLRRFSMEDVLDYLSKQLDASKKVI